MKKKLIITLAVWTLIIGNLFLVEGNAQDIDTKGKLIYSNLIDDESKTLLEDKLKSADVNEKYINSAINMVNDYNNHMTIFNEQDKEYLNESNLFNFQKGFNSTCDFMCVINSKNDLKL